MIAHKLLIRMLGGPYVLGPLLDPPVDQCLVRRWADGHPIPAVRIEQMRALAKNKTLNLSTRKAA